MMQGNSEFQKDLKKYKKSVRSLLLCNTEMSAKFMADFDNDIAAYIEEHKVSSMDEIYKQFGAPEAVAQSFFETADIKTIKRKISVKQTILCFLVALLAIYGIAMAVVVHNSKKTDAAYIAVSSAIEESSGDSLIQEVSSLS